MTRAKLGQRRFLVVNLEFIAVINNCLAFKILKDVYCLLYAKMLYSDFQLLLTSSHLFCDILRSNFLVLTIPHVNDSDTTICDTAAMKPPMVTSPMLLTLCSGEMTHQLNKKN